MRRIERSGFTTAEVVIALVIVAILLLIAIPQFTRPTLTLVAGPDSLSAPNGAGSVAVRVTNARGTAQRGVSVKFETEGHVVVDPAEASTDSLGIATSAWRASADTGRMKITIHAAGRTRPELVLESRVWTP